MTQADKAEFAGLRSRLKKREFWIIALFCAVGLGLTFYFMLIVPDCGQILASLYG